MWMNLEGINFYCIYKTVYELDGTGGSWSSIGKEVYPSLDDLLQRMVELETYPYLNSRHGQECNMFE